MAAAGGYIRIEADIEMHNPGRQSQKAANFALRGPRSQNPILPALPAKEPKPTDLTVDHLYHDKESVQAAKFDVQLKKTRRLSRRSRFLASMAPQINMKSVLLKEAIDEFNHLLMS